jgi:hypothetical protein
VKIVILLLLLGAMLFDLLSPAALVAGLVGCALVLLLAAATRRVP